MAYRQYIGARYVPLYVGDWDSTRNYEPLSIVTDGNGNSYTSLKDVPAGTQLNNRDYWILTSSFSGAMDVLQRRMNEAESDISDLQNSVATLDGDITTLQTALGALDTKIDEVSTKRIVYIADSYGSRQNGAGKTVGTILSDFGVNIVDSQVVSGGSFHSTDSNKRWINYLSAYTGDKTKVTDVIFCGSINDCLYTLSDVTSSAISTIQAAKRLYPNAKIHVFPWGASFNGGELNTNSIGMLPEAYQSACNATGAIYAENARYILRNSELLESDKYHPNAAGVDFLAGKLYGYIVNNIVDVLHEIDCSLTLHEEGATITSFQAAPAKMRRHNGTVVFEFLTAAPSALDFRFPTASGVVNLGFAVDLNKTLISYPRNDNTGFYLLRGYGTRLTPDAVIDGADLNVKFTIDYCNIKFLGDVYGGNYNRFIGKQTTIVMMD